MANIYVSPTGSDTSGDGSQSNPYKHIYYAIEQASDGDTVICLSGTYNEEEGISNIGKSITIQSSTGNYQDVIIENYTPVASPQEGSYHRILWGLNTSGKTVAIKNITIKLHQISFSEGQDIFYASAGTVEFVNCFLYDPNNTSKSRAILSRYNGCVGKIYKCTIRNFGCNGIYNEGDIYVKDTIFEHIGTNSGGWGGYAINNNGGIIQDEDHNCFYNNYADIHNATIDSTDITSDPKFTGTNTAEIQNDSPCKNAGTTITGYVEDYEGTAPDIGCYEVLEKIIITTKKATINSYNSVTLKGNISNLSGSAYVWFKYRIIGSPTWNETSKETVTSDGDFTKTITTTTNDYEFKALGQNTESGSSIEEGDVLNFYIMDNDENVSLTESKNLKFIELFNEALSLNDTSLVKYVEKVIMSESLSLTEDKKLKFNLYNIENLNIADSKKFKYITFFSDSLSLNSESKRVEKDAYNPWIIAEVINNEFPMDVDSNGGGIVDNWEGEGLGEISLIKDSYRNSVQEVEFLQNGRFYRQFSYNKKAIILFEIKPLFSVNFCIKQNNNIVYNYKFYSDDNWRLFLIPFTFNGDYVLEFNKEDYSYFYLDNFAIIDYNDYLKILEKKRPAPTDFGYNFEGGDIVNSFNENFSGNSPIKSDFSIKWDYSDFNHEKYLNNLINKKILVKTYLDEVFSFLILGINKSYHPNKQGRNQTYSLTLLVKEV